jgi:hypothetical protein
MGMLFPAGHFLDIAVGTFTKALDLRSCGRNAWRCSGSLSGSPG